MIQNPKYADKEVQDRVYKEIIENFYIREKQKYINHNKELNGYLSDFLPLGTNTQLVLSISDFQRKYIKEQRISKYSDPLIKDLSEKL